MYGRVEEVVLAEDEENYKGHVDMVVAGLRSPVECPQDGQHHSLHVGRSQHVRPEVGVAVEKEIEEKGGLVRAQGVAKGLEQSGREKGRRCMKRVSLLGNKITCPHLPKSIWNEGAAVSFPSPSCLLPPLTWLDCAMLTAVDGDGGAPFLEEALAAALVHRKSASR